MAVTSRSDAPPVPGPRLLGLELLRFCCAFAVLVWHYQHFGYDGGHLVIARSEQPFYTWLRPLYEHGYLGVQLFWCISGFVFFWKYGQAIAERRIDGRRFFVLRFSRLYPLHLATLLLVAVLQLAYQAVHGGYFVYQHNDAPHLLGQLLLASNWFNGADDESFNGPVWSVSVEVLVYAVFFASLRCCGASVRLAAAGALGGLAALLMHVQSPVIACAAFFYAGGLAALLLAQRPAHEHRRWAGGLAAVGAVAAIVAVVRRFEPDATTVTLLLCGTPLLLVVLTRGLRSLPAQWSRAVEAAGNLTYASYLLHFPLQLLIVLGCSMLHRPVPVHSGVFFGGFIAGVLALSAAVYRWFEMPAQAWIRRAAGAR